MAFKNGRSGPRRKTVDIEFTVNDANRLLALVGSTMTPDFRLGVMHMVENALHEVNRYAGFRYLTNKELLDTVLPGVRHNDAGVLPYPERFDNTDNTRIQYHLGSF